MVLTRGFERCVMVWPMEQWRVATEKLRQLPYGRPQVRQLYRLLFPGATEVVTDRLGRILIPVFLRRYAELGEQVVVAGLLDRIEIWSEGSWETVRSAAEAQGPQLAEDLLSGEFGREQPA
jgi:MraZ protein